MRTIEHPVGPDEVLEEVDTPSGKRLRVRRKLVFLEPVQARRLSAVSSPAVGISFSALKATFDKPDPSEETAKDTGEKASGGTDMDEQERAAIVEEAEKGAFAKFGAAFKQVLDRLAGTGATPELPPEADGTKYIGEGVGLGRTGGPTSVTQSLTLRELSNGYWDLKMAFGDVVRAALMDPDFGADRQTAIAQALADFGAGVNALLAKRTAAGLKAEGEGEGEKDKSAACGDEVAKESVKLVETALKVARDATKAGRVISTANMTKLKEAVQALELVLDSALPKPKQPEDQTLGHVGKEKGKGEGEGDMDEGELKGKGKGKKPTGKGDKPYGGGADGKGEDEVPGQAPAESEEMSEDEEETKSGKCGKKPTNPGKEAPAEGKKETAMDTQQKDAALEALEAVKGAESIEDMRAQLAKVEAALKGEEPSEVDALKAQMAGIEAMLSDIVAVMKSLPGLKVPGDVDPAGAKFGGQAQANAKTEEQVLRGGTAAFVGPKAPDLFSTPTTSVPSNAAVPVAKPAMKSEGEGEGDGEMAGLREQMSALKGQIELLAGMRPASKTFAGAPRRQASTSSWGSGGVIR